MPYALLLIATHEVDSNGGDGSHGKCPYQRTIQGAWTEESVGSDYSPEDTAVEVDSCDRTVEPVNGLRCADAGNVNEHPIEDTDLGETRDQGGDHLYRE